MLRKGDGTAVAVATSLCELDMLREFLNKYPKKVDTVSNGRTALHLAASAGLADAMKILLEFKADVELQVKAFLHVHLLIHACLHRFG